MQARDILDEMKKISFQGLNDDELDRILEAGTGFDLTDSSLPLVEDMKLAVRYVTDLIHVLDSRGNKFLLLYILEQHNVQIYQSEDEASQNLGYMAFGICSQVQADFRLCSKNQKGSFLCYEYEKKADDYYVSDYEEDFDETKFSAEQIIAMFDLKICFQVKEVVEDLSRASLEVSYLFQIEFVNHYEMFLEDIGNLLDYLGY